MSGKSYEKRLETLASDFKEHNYAVLRGSHLVMVRGRKEPFQPRVVVALSDSGTDPNLIIALVPDFAPAPDTEQAFEIGGPDKQVINVGTGRSRRSMTEHWTAHTPFILTAVQERAGRIVSMAARLEPLEINQETAQIMVPILRS